MRAAGGALRDLLHRLVQRLRPRPPRRPARAFLVHGGTSGIGTTAIQLAAARGARVFATAGSEAKARPAATSAPSSPSTTARTDFVDAVRSATDGRGVDVILDMVGGDYLPRDVRALALDGRLVMIAHQSGPKVELNFAQVMVKRLTITGSTLRPQSVEAKARIAADLRREVWPLLDAGRIAPVIDRSFPLEAAAEAHAYLESSAHIGKIVLDVA